MSPIAEEECKRLGITARNGVTIQDRHRVLEEFPAVREALHSWVDDIAPKLPGLHIKVREDGPMGLGITMSVQVGGLQCFRLLLVDRYDLEWMLESDGRDRGPLRRAFEREHLDLIRDLRAGIASGKIPVGSVTSSPIASLIGSD